LKRLRDLLGVHSPDVILVVISIFIVIALVGVPLGLYYFLKEEKSVSPNVVPPSDASKCVVVEGKRCEKCGFFSCVCGKSHVWVNKQKEGNKGKNKSNLKVALKKSVTAKRKPNFNDLYTGDLELADVDSIDAIIGGKKVRWQNRTIKELGNLMRNALKSGKELKVFHAGKHINVTTKTQKHQNDSRRLYPNCSGAFGCHVERNECYHLFG